MSPPNLSHASREAQTRSDFKAVLDTTSSSAGSEHEVVPCSAAGPDRPTYRPPWSAFSPGGGRKCQMTLGGGGASGSLSNTADHRDDVALGCSCHLDSAAN